MLYWLIRSVGALPALLPLRMLYPLSTALSWFTGVLFGYRRMVVEQNLRNAFPQFSKAQLQSALKQFYMHFTDTLVETYAMLAMRKDRLPRRIRVKNPELLNRYHAEGKSVIAVGGHFGNWEWLGTALPLLSPYPVLAAYRPLSNPSIDRLMREIRSIHGTRLLPDTQIYRAMRSSTEPVLTYLIADQSPLPENARWLPFLNQETPVFMGPEKMARACNAVVVFLAMRRIQRGYYEVEVLPVTENPQGEDDLVITKRHLELLENEIQSMPSAWLWSHKRWKHRKPE